MITINPWINFNGNAEDAFTFYKSVFGGEFGKIIRLKDLAGPGFPVADADAEKIMQIILSIGDGQMLIGNDVPTFMGKVSEEENRSKIHLQVDTKEEATRIVDELSSNGNVEAPLGESPWGTHFSMFRDKYGIEWIVESK
jgi:PhnB protein